MSARILLTSLLISMLSGLALAQHTNCEVRHDSLYYDSLLTEYGQNKSLNPEFLEPALLALKAYPELKGATITFIRKPIKTLMAARPTPDFIFRAKSKRHYYVIISTSVKNNSEDLLQRMSKCALTGILAHEYAHIIDYSSRSDLGMIWFGIRYFFDKKKIETGTDLEAINRGFGDELIEFDRYIYKSKFASKKYLLNKKKYYLSVNEIQQRIKGDL